MIRRDYLLRQIEQFVGTLAKIAGLTKAEQWQEASTVTAGEFQRLTGMDAAGVVRMSETELLARLIQGEPTQVVESKAFMLATLLKANGDLIAGQGRPEESRQYYLKGLHLLLDTVGRNEVTERPDFAPTVEAFLTGLRDAPLPVMTNAMLMHHYERIGEFARAEDALFGLVDAGPDQVELLDFGRLFYQRLLGLDDAALSEGNLPRAEVTAGLAELDKRKARLRRTTGDAPIGS
ncbi:MAG: DUF6483 family protein [Verrucomicrobiota bacterium]|jgi:hypothetical protein